MKVLNFSHPLTAQQIEQLAARAGIVVSEIEEYRIPVQLNMDEPMVKQIIPIVPNLPTVDDVLFKLPGFPEAAALLLYGLKERFSGAPISILRLKPVTVPVGTSYEVAEIIVV